MKCVILGWQNWFVFIWNVFLVGKTSRCFIWNVLSWVGKTDLFHMKCVILGWQNGLVSYEMCYPGLANWFFSYELFSWLAKLADVSYEMCYPGLAKLTCFIWNVLSWVGKTDLFSYEMFSWLAKLADVSYEMCYPGYASRCFIWTVWGNSYEFKLRFEVIHMKRMFHMKGLG